jgi:uncharacterized protein (TIGR02271 family)
MAQTVNVVGLFRQASQVPQVVQELVSRGFRREDIQQLTSHSTGTQLNSQIAYLGASPEEARFWSQGVQNGGTLLTLQTTQDRAEEAMDIMERFSVAQIEEQNLQGVTQSTVQSTARQSAPVQGETTIPIVEEQIQVGKREVQRGGVRVFTHVTDRPVEENVQLREEHVTVERRPVDRPVTEADRAAFQQGTIEVTERAEEAVVSKQARVVEELVVGKEATERTETVRDTVRRTEVEVEELAPEHKLGVSDFSAYDTDFRSDFQSRYGTSGARYEQYQPAYSYGYDLANDPRYTGRDWNSIEPEVRRDWEARHAGSPWERFQDSVRFAWERGRGSGQRAESRVEGALGGNQVPGIQTGGHAADGSPDQRGVLEKIADAFTGNRTDDKTSKPVQ